MSIQIQIAAQPLAHIPPSRRGEVLLMQQMRIAPPAALISSAPKGLLNTLCSGTLFSGQVEALDVLFLAFDGRAWELFIEDP